MDAIRHGVQNACWTLPAAVLTGALLLHAADTAAQGAREGGSKHRSWFDFGAEPTLRGATRYGIWDDTLPEDGMAVAPACSPFRLSLGACRHGSLRHWTRPACFGLSKRNTLVQCRAFRDSAMRIEPSDAERCTLVRALAAHQGPTPNFLLSPELGCCFRGAWHRHPCAKPAETAAPANDPPSLPLRHTGSRQHFSALIHSVVLRALLPELMLPEVQSSHGVGLPATGTSRARHDHTLS